MLSCSSPFQTLRNKHVKNDFFSWCNHYNLSWVILKENVVLKVHEVGFLCCSCRLFFHSGLPRAMACSCVFWTWWFTHTFKLSKELSVTSIWFMNNLRELWTHDSGNELFFLSLKVAEYYLKFMTRLTKIDKRCICREALDMDHSMQDHKIKLMNWDGKNIGLTFNLLA